MKIYLIDSEQTFSEINPEIKNYREVILLDSGEKEISKYPELFFDNEPKILAISPGVIEWKFPLEDLSLIKNLKGICSKSSWVFYLDVDYCKKHKITVTNVPGANSLSVAEYAFWMMLSLVRKLPAQQSENYKVQYDDKHLQIEISGKRMGIIGLGNIGSRLAKMGKAFEMDIWYWSRRQKDVPYRYSSVEEILANADFIFDCLEVCPETQGFLGKDKLSLMRPKAFFICVMGGANWGVEDDSYLAKMVEEGKLSGFAVENEHKSLFPGSFNGNVFIPGAYAWYTKEAKERTLKGFTASIIGVSTGKLVNEVK